MSKIVNEAIEWLDTLISEQAFVYNLDEKLIGAIIYEESKGDTFKTRYEKTFTHIAKTEIFAKKLGISHDTEIMHQKMSWGLMQVMGGTARDFGYEGHLPGLLKPLTGIKYGCIYLRYQLDRYGDRAKAVSAYNSGTARLKVDGLLENQSYVNRVKKSYRALGGKWK